MAELITDYFDIGERIRSILDESLEGAVVVHEEPMVFSPDTTPWVCVYLESRTLADRQFFRAGKRVDYTLNFVVWVWAYSLEVKSAVQERNKIIADVEATLMSNPTLNDLVETSMLQGGAMTVQPVQGDGGFEGTAAGGEVRIAVMNPSIVKE